MIKRAILLGVLLASFAPTVSESAPDVLDQIILNVNPRQVVGQPLISPARVLLVDENGTLLTDYDLAANPIVLSCPGGALVPDTISDPALFFGGIVNLLPAQIRYFGPTGNTALLATASSIQSSPVLISFSGYEIDGVVNLSPDTTISIFANTSTSITVRVINRGDQIASSEPNLRASFFSSGNSTEVSYAPSANGRVESLNLELPTTGLLAGPDTLSLTLQSAYLSGGQTVSVVDTLLLPVLIYDALGLRFVSSSVEPDSVYAGIPFDLSFALATGGVTAPWDSTKYRFEVLTVSDSLVAVVYDNSVIPVGTKADTLVYGDITTQLSESVLPGVYRSQASFSLFMGGLVLRPLTPYVGEFAVLPQPSLHYEPGTLRPTAVTSGQEWNFEFDLALDGDQAMTLSPAESFLKLSIAHLSAETTFPESGITLYPGLNHITTNRVFIPFEFLGLSLNAMGTASYYHPGSANVLTFSTDFAGETVSVEALPLIRIVETYVVAPNAPIINTEQPFQVVCVVGNLSPTAMTAFDLQLVSDGSSVFAPLVTVEEVPGGQTVEAIFEVVAADLPNPAEIFRVDIASAGVNRLPPIDNIALVTVQRPAEISVSVIVRGADQGYVNPGNGFDILIGIINTGEAQATSGRFKINTNGMDLGLPDGDTIIEEVVAAGAVRGVSFVAPPFDTAFRIDIDLIERPIDENTGLSAITGDTSFQVSLPVTSLDLNLHFEASRVPSHVVLPEDPRDLLILRAFNPGTSSISNIRLKSLKFSFFGADRLPLPVRSVLEVGSTGLFYEAHLIARATAGENRLTLLFPDYVVPAGDTVELVLRTKVLARNGTEFTVDLRAEDIIAEVASGPLQGIAVGAVTGDGSGVVVEEVFTLVENTLAGSFAVRNNPWDPRQGQAEFMYYLPQADDVTFVVLTLTGEEVYRAEFRSGENGAKTGENFVAWDGRTDDGSFAVNGVYVVVVKTSLAREKATLKLAVLK